MSKSSYKKLVVVTFFGRKLPQPRLIREFLYKNIQSVNRRIKVGCSNFRSKKLLQPRLIRSFVYKNIRSVNHRIKALVEVTFYRSKALLQSKIN